MPEPGPVVIIGGGPCGLACARELDRLGHPSWVVLEGAPVVGGLAGSVVDAAGFTWDHGGHVVFSHYGEFDRLLDEVLGDDVERHDRTSYVWFADGWVPYPFQNNLHRLPPDVAYECVVGLIDAGERVPGSDFASWMRARFGDGISDHFMDPYNRKVWVTDPAAMSASWMAERVSEVDVKRVLRSVVHREDDVAWGPNSQFAFPSTGGTGEIYRRLAESLGDRVRTGRQVVAIDVDRDVVVTEDGEEHPYGALVSTMPLDLLVRTLTSVPAEVRAAAARLRHTTVTIVGVGYEAPVERRLSWAYFPQPDVPFYRATNFGAYAAANVPGGDAQRFSSWMTEIAHEPGTVLPDDVVATVDAALRRAGLVAEDAPVVSTYRRTLPYAYPVPTLDRDDALAVIQPWLGSRGIHSRGRFGAWRYELGNMDHAVKMGIDVAAALVCGDTEEAWAS